MRKQIPAVYTVDEIKAFEIVSDKVSDKYVPIYSTDLIEILSPEFELVQAKRTTTSLTSHFVDMVNKDGDRLRIYNSYDGTLAFRMSLFTGTYGIDLGTDRVIHRGKTAKSLKTILEESKQDILNSVKTAKKIKTKLSELDVDKETAKNISNTVFLHRTKQKGFEKYTNYVDILVEKTNISIDKYINMTVDKYINGDYTYVENGKKKNGRKANSTLLKIRIENSIISNLMSEYPECFL